MSLNRRQFLVTSTLTVAAGALRGLPAFGQAAQTPPETRFEALRDGVGLFSGRGGTIGWLVSDEGVVVVDSQFPDTAEACLAGLKQRSSRPVDLLINTHHHGDHTGGNKTFRPAVKQIVAHEQSAAWQKRVAQEQNREADQAYPDVTFPDRWSTTFGQETVRAVHLGRGHTSGDAVVFFQNANIVHMGDLMFHELHPFVDRAAGASIVGWIAFLEKVAAAHDAETIYIFGHARPGMAVTGSQKHLLAFRDYFNAVLEHTRALMTAGRPREEIVEAEVLPGFESYVSPSPRLSLGGVLGVAYDELSES